MLGRAVRACEGADAMGKVCTNASVGRLGKNPVHFTQTKTPSDLKNLKS